MRPFIRPNNEGEFDELMEELDEILRSEQVPIPARELHAQRILAVDLGEPFIHPYPRYEPRESVFAGHDLTIRVERWFKQRYGDRLKIDFTPGVAVALLKGDPWLIKLPRFFGTWRLIADPGIKSDSKHHNILESVQELTPSLAAVLSDRERQELLRVFVLAHSCFESLEKRQAVPFIWQALTDHRSAVQHIIARPVDFGQSKWSSLQAVEKTLKAYISGHGVKVERTHRLQDLASTVVELGGPTLAEADLEAVQCEASARYGQHAIDLIESIRAHHKALDLCHQVACHISIPRTAK